MTRTRLLTAALTLLAIAPLTASAQRDRDYDRRDSRDYRDSRDAEKWNWTGNVEQGRWLYIRNLNGAVRVEPSTGNTIEVQAMKYPGRRGNTRDVKITVEQRSGRGDVVICAIWNENTRCDEDGYRNTTNSRDWQFWRDRDNRGDVSVDFVVRLPRGVRITATSVNGGVEVDGVESEVVAHTVNGNVTARTNGGPVSAKTVNGSLFVRTGDLGRGDLDYSTTNGQITLEIPSGSNADLDLRTVNGDISSDFPLTIEGRFNTRRVRGTIGRGGQLVRLHTTNGSIRVRRS
jgi:hypothetical protein